MKRKLLALFLTLSMALSLSAAALAAESSDTFSDVGENSWYAGAVAYVSGKGYMNGYADGSFAPGTTVTYAQLYQTLYQIQGSPSTESSTFTDVPENSWYADAAAWAQSAGLAEGKAFNGSSGVTRESLAKILVDYAGYVGRSVKGGSLEDVADSDEIDAALTAAVASALGTGLMSGYAGGSFRPGETLTRAQLAQILQNFDALDASYDSEQRPILLQGAMTIETQDMMDALTDPVSYRLGQWDYVAGTYAGYPVVVCRTEQGMANTGASTALAMEFFHPVAVINQGTSGGHDPDLHTFDIVLGKQSTNYSAWKSKPSAKGAGVDYKALEQNGVYAYDKDEKTFVKEVYHAGDAKLLAAANAVKDSYTQGSVVEGTISSCDAWNNQIDRMLFLHEFYGSSCEEMETDAAAQICKTYDVPFLGIRILSNTGIYGENFDPATGPACQAFVLDVVEQYIASYLKTAPDSATANTAKSSLETQSYDKTLRPILLEGAMTIESDDMIAALSDAKEYTLGQWRYAAGTYEGYPVVVCRTEQGLANTGASTALAMEFFHPVAVINQGTSGGHDPDLHTFDIVLGKQSVNSTAWKTEASEKGAGVDYTAFEMNGVYAYDKSKDTFVQSVYYDGDAGLLAAANAAKPAYTKGSVVEGVIGTSDEWNNQIDRMLYLHETAGTSVEEMETNAAAQICRTYGVPYLGIRILSNTGIHGEDFDPASGPACQAFVLETAKQYIKANLA